MGIFLSKETHYTIHPKFIQGLGWIIFLIGFLGIFGFVFHIQWLRSYLPDTFTGAYHLMSLPSALGITLLGFSMQLLGRYPPGKVIPKLYQWVLFFTILLPGCMGLYYVGLYLIKAHVDFLAPFYQRFSDIPLSFMAALNMVFSSFALWCFTKRKLPSAVLVYGTGIPALIIFNFCIFAVAGYWEQLPILYDFMMSIPTILGFMLLSSAILLYGTFADGLVLTLFSKSKKSRIISILSMGLTLGILAEFIWTISHIDKVLLPVVRQYQVNLHLEHLYAILELATISLAVITKTVILRAVHYFNQSVILGKKEAKEATRNAILAGLGQEALAGVGTNPQSIIQKSIDFLASDLKTDYIAYFEVGPGDPARLLLKAGSGWPSTFMNKATLETTLKTPEFLTLLGKEPLIIENLQHDSRFPYNSLLYQLGIVSGVIVYVYSFGILTAFSLKKRRFTNLDIHFLQSIANILALVLERQRAEVEIEAINHIKNKMVIASQRKSQVLANMSHELRTPLNAIIGYSEMLEEGHNGELSERQQKYIRNISTSGHHLLTMVNDILDISKVEAGKLSLFPEWVDFKILVEELKATITPMAQQRNVQVHFHLQSDVKGMEADLSRLRQIFLNLLSNAVKFNKIGGSIFVEIVKEPEQPWLSIQVKDTGIGIPESKMNELFLEFHQLETSPDKQQAGTGLGLVLTKQLVELHGGYIEVESHEGEGSIFTIHLPLFQHLQSSSDPLRKAS